MSRLIARLCVQGHVIYAAPSALRAYCAACGGVRASLLPDEIEGLLQASRRADASASDWETRAALCGIGSNVDVFVELAGRARRLGRAIREHALRLQTARAS